MSISNEERISETWADDGGKIVSTDGPSFFSARKFQVPDLKGISHKNVKEHLELYSGYVKFTNEIVNRIRSMPKDEKFAFDLSFMRRVKRRITSRHSLKTKTGSLSNTALRINAR